MDKQLKDLVKKPAPSLGKKTGAFLTESAPNLTRSSPPLRCLLRSVSPQRYPRVHPERNRYEDRDPEPSPVPEGQLELPRMDLAAKIRPRESDTRAMLLRACIITP